MEKMVSVLKLLIGYDHLLDGLVGSVTSCEDGGLKLDLDQDNDTIQ